MSMIRNAAVTTRRMYYSGVGSVPGIIDIDNYIHVRNASATNIKNTPAHDVLSWARDPNYIHQELQK
jgi:hypothetical protein